MGSDRKHEIRDPIHNFISLKSDELKIVDSLPFQRLRHIHQLALTYLLYPGATHKRFEHSLGVMELSSEVYNVITEPSNIFHESVKKIVPPKGDFWHKYWCRVLRMAALCHDLGHLPFSHAAEKELLPEGWSHERITLEIIRSDMMAPIWSDLKINTEDIGKLAVGPKYYRDAEFTDWEAILSEIIVGDSFGVDRIDYLLRDSHHTGVAYGKFDHYRLIDTLRILPKGEINQGEGPYSQEPALGVEEGGLHSAEALLLARYFMFTQVYCHHVRRIYDIHLKDFLKQQLTEGIFSTGIDDILSMTDNEVTSSILKAARDSDLPGYESARRILHREHFRLLYQRNPVDLKVNKNASRAVFEAACERYGDSMVRFDTYKQRGGGIDFPVYTRDSRVLSSLSLSETLEHIPVVAIDYVFINPEKRADAEVWRDKNLERIISSRVEEDTG